MAQTAQEILGGDYESIKSSQDSVEAIPGGAFYFEGAQIDKYFVQDGVVFEKGADSNKVGRPVTDPIKLSKLKSQFGSDFSNLHTADDVGARFGELDYSGLSLEESPETQAATARFQGRVADAQTALDMGEKGFAAKDTPGGNFFVREEGAGDPQGEIGQAVAQQQTLAPFQPGSTGNPQQAPVGTQAVQQQQQVQQQQPQQGLPPGTLVNIDGAFARAQQGGGFDFTDNGTTDERSNARAITTEEAQQFGLGQPIGQSQTLTQMAFQPSGVDYLSLTGANVEALQVNPIGEFENTYKSIYGELGLSSVQNRIEQVQQEFEDLQNEKAEKARDINDNPWFTEGRRVSELRKLDEEYQDRELILSNRLQLEQATFETGVEEARYFATAALNQANADRAFAFDQIEFAIERADKQLAAERALQQQAFENNLAIGDRNRDIEEFEREFALRERQVGIQAFQAETSRINATNQSQILSLAGFGDASEGTQLVYGTPEYVQAKLLSTAASKTKPVASEREQLGKFGNVIAQTSNLVSSLSGTDTGPVLGYLKSLNPYDFDARAVNAQVNALVPNVARGVYGEVGVLTDQDIERYLLTLPNIKSTTDQNRFVALMTMSNAMRSYEQTLLNLANSNVNVAGFADSYKAVVDQVAGFESQLGVGTGLSATTEEQIFDDVVSSQSTSSSSWYVNLWNKLF